MSAIEAGFDKLPDLTSVPNQMVFVNAGSTALTSSGDITFDGTSLSIGSGKFTVNKSSGNTAIAGTLALGTSGMSVTGTASSWGFGVTPNTWSLGKAIETGFTGTALAGVAQDALNLTSNLYYNSGYKFAGTGYATLYGTSAGAHAWYTSSASGTAGNAATMNTTMQLSATGTLTVAGGPTDFISAANGTAGFKGGSVGARATTEPTNAVSLANGTAPVGAATNTGTFYVTAGEMRVMDAAGNATLLSPHDGDRNWIHHCEKGDGNEILIRMEQMAGMLNEMFGKDFLAKFGVPFIEDGKVDYEEIDTGYLGADFKPLMIVRKTRTIGARP